ncbi:MAG: hypothetical protein WC356_04770 [Candidatus Micrarchaeia archaeon]|jgi:hypothetical protein
MAYEDYRENHKEILKKILKVCSWNQVSKDLYEKGRSRIYVDDIGIFLYRRLAGVWCRTCGLSHNRITTSMLRERLIVFPDYTLNLLIGG